ncbi:MAG: hypothetical protein OEW00_13855, partial [candidate division Zixibacteria bacterium]|nr:hypothetical protein [candidate division Zixibacteria bacterium]
MVVPKHDRPERVSIDRVWQTIANEASGFYKLVVTVASSFLGGTLIFLQTISGSPSRTSLVLLFTGWALLIGSIVLVINVRRLNLDSGHNWLKEDYDRCKAIDRKSRLCSQFAAIALAFGLAFVMAFGGVNLWNSDWRKGQIVTEKEKKTADVKPEQVRWLGFGSLPGSDEA